MRQKTKRSNPVSDANKHHAFIRQASAIRYRVGGRTKTKAATVNPHQYRELIGSGIGGCPEIQIKAIFTFTSQRLTRLNRGGRKRQCLATPCPAFAELRCFPA